MHGSDRLRCDLDDMTAVIQMAIQEQYICVHDAAQENVGEGCFQRSRCHFEATYTCDGPDYNTDNNDEFDRRQLKNGDNYPRP